MKNTRADVPDAWGTPIFRTFRPTSTLRNASVPDFILSPGSPTIRKRRRPDGPRFATKRPLRQHHGTQHIKKTVDGSMRHADMRICLGARMGSELLNDSSC